MSWIVLFDFIGTVAFAISGAFVGIRKKMDLFGVIMLSVTTACGGGIIRDLLIGNVPPCMFRNPAYCTIAGLVGITTFLLIYKHRKLPKDFTVVYDRLLFWFDTLGLAAFVVDGVMVGVGAGYRSNAFLLVFLGFMTGVGGGAFRDIMANQMPDIFVKHIYAVSAIAGAMVLVLILSITEDERIAMTLGFVTVVVLRCLAVHYKWNLPRVGGSDEKTNQ